MKNFTGEYRFRNEGDLLVLQVCEVEYHPYGSEADKEIWRDAKTEDLLNVEFCRERDMKLPEPIQRIAKFED